MFEDITGTAGAGGSGAAPPAAAGSGVSAPPAGNGNGSVAAPPAAPPVINWETAPQQLRTEYETQKAEAARLKTEQEKWSKLGDYDQVSQLHTTFSQKLTQAAQMGKSLGYTDDQIRQSMLEDPKGTLAFLQQEMSKPAATSREELEKQLEKIAETKFAPVLKQIDEARNDEATALYTAEQNRLFKTEFDGYPDEFRDEVFAELDSLVSADPAALSRLKFGKQVSDVARHFAQAKTTVLKRHNAYIEHERKRTGGIPPGGPAKPNGQAKESFMDRKLSFGGTVKDIINV